MTENIEKTDETTVTNKALMDGIFGFGMILSIMWALSVIAYSLATSIPIDWLFTLRPIGIIVLLQAFLLWVEATIRNAVKEGLVIGLTQAAILQEQRTNAMVSALRTNKEKLN